MLPRTLLVAVALAVAACGPDGPVPPDAGPQSQGCTAGFVGDKAKALEIVITTLDASGHVSDVTDGGSVPLVTPPQGGQVIFAGARATNLEACEATIQGVLRDEQSKHVTLDSRTINLLPTQGGWLETDPQAPEAERYRLTPEHLLRPMSLESAGQGVSPATDVAAAASANSILVVAQQADKSLAWLLFDNRGNLLSGPTPAEVHATRPEGQIGQNAVVVVMCLMVGLAFMQWRRKVEPLALPAGTAIAPLALRLGALAIDLAVSYILVLVIFSAWENGGYIGLAESWFAGMSRPEDLFTAPQFPTFAGIYLLQVTLGEMFFRRSVGKALTGLQVLMLDGKSPTVAAILVRNLLRLPECIMAIGLLFALLSDRKQRLGDSLARTVVVSQPGPETPKDPDQ